jgi:general secretion pathway protein D
MLNSLISCKRHIITLILVLFFLAGTFCLSAEQQNTTEYDFLSFSNISADQGQKYLMDAKIGDVSHFPNSPTVLFTSSIPGSLQKARLIKNLVDCTEEYAVKVIACDLKSKPLPSREQIRDNIGTIAIGSFANPPDADGYARTIVDTCNNNIIIIAPSRMMERIVKSIEKLQNSKTDIFGQTRTPAIINPNKTEIFTQSGVNENAPIISPAFLTESVSTSTSSVEPKKKTQNIFASNERITDSTPVNITSQSSPQEKPLPTQSNLLAANDVINALSVPNPEDEVVLSLSDQLTLTEFIGWVGPYLKMDFMYNADDFIGKNVTINPNGVLKGRIKIKDLYKYLDAVLRFKGFAMTRDKGTNLITIVPKDNVLPYDPTIAQPGQEPVQVGDSVRVDFFELKYISTSTAEDLIKNMKLSIQINSIPETKTLIVTEYTSRMPRIKALLDIIDKPGEPKKFVYRQLQYTIAQTLAPKIQALAQQLGTVSITISSAGPETNLPERPVKRDGESDAAFTNRMRNWEAEVRRITTEAANRARTPAPSPAVSAEPESSTVFLDSDERTNRILMIGLEDKIKEVENLIDALDVVQRDPRKLQIYKIKFLDAEEVMKKLEDLGIITKSQDTQGSSGTSRTTRSGPGQPARITSEPASIPVTAESGKSASETPSAVGEAPLVVLVSSLNSLLVNATDEQQERIAAIIDLVDKAREGIPFKVYKLKNTNPVYIKDMLDKLIEKTVETVRNPDDKIQSSVVSKVSMVDEQMTIVADPNTSSLVVYASRKNQEWIESLIKELDKRKPQVLIDVTLVQISKTDAFDYDLNLISSFPDLTNTSGLTNAILPGISAGASNLFDPPIGSSGYPKAHYVDFQSNGGNGTAFYGDRHINALLKLMEQKDYGRVMAKPKILVNDNQEGTISTTDRTYVKTTSAIPVTNGTAGNQQNLIQTQENFTPYDAGIELKITPHISESNLLRLDIGLKRSDFLPTTDSAKPPDTTDSAVGTTVTVPDGSTIILGGMIKLNQSKGGTKIPLLGDLPFIGGVFRSTSNSDIQRNLYVFVKAEIIRPPDEETAGQPDLERISKQNRDAFEKFENEFQGYQSFPPVKPSPMAPAKTLDSD